MLPSTLWQKEVVEATTNGRSLFIKFAFPLAIGGIFLLVTPPGFYTATIITLLAAMTGCFGTGITLSKARGEGMLQRIALTPLSPRRIVIEQLAINSAVDYCQILPLMLIVAVRFGAYDSRMIVVLMALGAAILAANLLGLLMTLFATSAGEVMLYSSLALFPLLYLGGVFSPVAPDAGPRSMVAAGIPFFYLQQSLLAVIGENTGWSIAHLGELSIAGGFAAAVVATLIAPRALRFEL